MSKQLTQLKEEQQNCVLETFVDFIKRHMEDYRLRKDRSRLVSDSGVNSDPQPNEATESDSDQKK